MKKVTKLLLATSVILLSNIAYASDQPSEPSPKSGSKRTRAALEASEALEQPNTPLYQPNGSVGTTEDSNKKGRSSKGKKKGKTRGEESSLITHLPEEITLLYTSFLDMQSVVDLASCSKPLRHFLSTFYHLEAMRAFVTLDPALDEEKGFKLWNELHSLFGKTIEKLYRDRYEVYTPQGLATNNPEIDDDNSEIDDDKPKIDYGSVQNTTHLKLFLYAHGLIRGKPSFIGAALKLPEDPIYNKDIEIKRRALYIFHYLSSFESNQKSPIYKGSLEMEKQLANYLYVLHLTDKGLTWSLRAGNFYDDGIKSKRKKILKKLNLPNSGILHDFDYSEHETEADRFFWFAKAVKKSGEIKQKALNRYFSHTDKGKIIKDLSLQSKEIMENRFAAEQRGYNLTFQQENELYSKVVEFFTSQMKQMLRNNRKELERHNQGSVHQEGTSFLGNL